MVTRLVARRVGIASAVLILLSSVLSIGGAVRPAASRLVGPFGLLTDSLFVLGVAAMATATILFLKLGHNGDA